MRIVEQDSAAEDQIDEDRLKFCISKVKFWDYLRISQQKLSSIILEERTSLLKIYYRDLDAKFQVSGKIYLLFVSFFSVFFAVTVLLLVVVSASLVKKGF